VYTDIHFVNVYWY